MPITDSSETFLRSPLKRVRLIPPAPTAIKEPSKATKDWALGSLRDDYLKLEQLDWTTFVGFDLYLSHLGTIKKEYYIESVLPFVRPRGEADVAGIVSTQIVERVRRVTEEFLDCLQSIVASKDALLYMEALQEQYRSETTDDGEKSGVRLDQGFTATVYGNAMDPFHSYSPDPKKHRLGILDRGTRWDPNADTNPVDPKTKKKLEDKTSLALAKFLTVVEVKDSGRIDPEGWKELARSGLAIGSSDIAGLYGNLSPRAQAARAQGQQSLRYSGYFRTGYLFLTDYETGILLLIPPGYTALGDEPPAKLIAQPANGARLKSAGASNARITRSKTLSVQAFTPITVPQDKSERVRRIKWAVVKQDDQKLALGFLNWLAVKELLETHDIIDSRFTGTDGAPADMDAHLAQAEEASSAQALVLNVQRQMDNLALQQQDSSASGGAQVTNARQELPEKKDAKQRFQPPRAGKSSKDRELMK